MLSSVAYSAEFRHLFALREQMIGWRLLQLDRAPLHEHSPATASEELEADGSNLAAVLAAIRSKTMSEDEPEGALSDIGNRMFHDMVTDLFKAREGSGEELAPLAQLILYSHSPEVLGALVDDALVSRYGSVLFADAVSVADPVDEELRRRSRFHPVRHDPQIDAVPGAIRTPAHVSDYEVRSVLDTVGRDG